MMRASPFRYYAPTSVAEAARILRAEGPGARILAGGTDLVPNMKRRQQTPSALISLRRIESVRGVTLLAGGGLSIGAAVTLGEAALDATIAGSFRALSRAAASVATPPIRAVATVGGNLCLDTRCNYYNQNLDWRQAIDFCMKAPRGEAVEQREGDAICWVATSSPRCWAVSSTDTAPALIALGVRVHLESAEGAREIALEDLYRDDGMAYLTRRPDEVLTHIEVPAPAAGTRSTYWKLRRRGSFDFPVLGVAASVRLGAGGVVEDARVVLGAVASRPLLVEESAMLLGRPLTDDSIRAFADAASKHAKPLDNTDFTLLWRKKVARVYLEGALKELRGDDPATLGLLARRAAAGTLPVLA
jgi:4-hydroxybenzoyl-CoA reductase subunit beta